MLQLKILNRSLFVKSNWTRYLAVKKSVYFVVSQTSCVGEHYLRLRKIAKDFHFYISVEARVCDHHNTCEQRFLLKPQPKFLLWIKQLILSICYVIRLLNNNVQQLKLQLF